MEARELQAYRDRWKGVAAFEKEERRQVGVDVRWRQLNSLLGMATAMGLAIGADVDEVDTVRRRWNRLKDLSVERSGDGTR